MLRLDSYSSMKKKIRKILMIFDIENLLSFWHFATRQQFLGKASRDTYNQGGWLILQDFFKNWVAEGVASEVNDSNCLGTLI